MSLYQRIELCFVVGAFIGFGVVAAQSLPKPSASFWLRALGVTIMSLCFAAAVSIAALTGYLIGDAN